MACCLGNFIGRTLFVAIFVLSGIKKLQTPSQSSSFLVARMEMLEKLVADRWQFSLPAPYKTSEFKPHADNFILGVGVYLIVAGVGTLFAYRVANCLLGLFLVLTIVIVHNPLYKFEKPADQQNELNQFVMNMALWGVSMVMCGICGSSATCKPKKQKAPKKTAQETDASSSTTGQSGKKDKKKKSKRD